MRTRLATTALFTLGLVAAGAQVGAAEQEYYELRAYRTPDAAMQGVLLEYLENGLVPALDRAGLDRVGVFTVIAQENEAPDHSVWMIIPFPDAATFTGLRPRLEADDKYLAAAAAIYTQPKESPVYSRVESWFMKAFSGMPTLVLPEQTAAGQPRIFEVRVYKSHNDEMARRKIDMFNSGEIEIMFEVGLAPLLYGETLIGDNVPNLTYILTAPDMESHREHWKAFGAHPLWKKMRSMPKYQGTVSGIENFFLEPADFSQQ